MLFALMCIDKPGSIELRQQTRPAHRAYIATIESKIKSSGGLYDAAGLTIGSFLMVEALDLAEATRMAQQDPFAKAGLFASTALHAYVETTKDGKRISG